MTNKKLKSYLRAVLIGLFVAHQAVIMPVHCGPGPLYIEYLEGYRRKGAKGCPFSAALIARDGVGGNVTFSSSNLPAGATLTQTSARTALLEWNNIPFNSAPSAIIDVTGSGGGESATAQLKVTIVDSSPSPVMKTRIPETIVAPNVQAQVALDAWDPDGDPVIYSLVTPNAYATGAVGIADNGNGTATLQFTPTVAGTQYIQVKISDPFGNSRTFPVCFRVGDMVSAVQSGPWSAGSTWDRGVAPDASSIVMIMGHSVTLDTNAQAVEVMVHAGGALIADRTRSTSLELNGSLMVMENGTLEVGTEASPLPANVSCEIRFVVPDDKLVVGATPYFPGPDVTMNDSRMGDIGLQVMGDGARMTLSGSPIVNTWNRLTSDAKPGDTIINVNGSIADWAAGNTVVVTPFENPAKTERRTIQSISGNQITLTSSLSQFHPGSRYAYEPNAGTLRTLASAETPATGEKEILEQCEVGLLTRNVRIRSDLTKGNGHAHTIFMMGATGGYRYTELKDLGPLKLGRYSIHMHRIQSQANGVHVLGNAIHNDTGVPLNKGITIHTSGGVTADDNIIIGPIMGSAIYLEDAEEANNQVNRNLMVDVRGPEPFPQPQLAAAFGYDVNLAVALWARTANAFSDNVVVAGPTSMALGATPLNLTNPRSIEGTFQRNQLRGGKEGMGYLGKAIRIDLEDSLLVCNNIIATFLTDQDNGLLNSVLYGNTNQPFDNAALQARMAGQRVVNNTLLSYAKDPIVQLKPGTPDVSTQPEVTLSYYFADGFFSANKARTFSLTPGKNKLRVQETGRSGLPVYTEWTVTYNGEGQTVETPTVVKNVVNPMKEPFKIKFDLAKDTHVQVKIFDRIGRLIRDLLSDDLTEGTHWISWDGKTSGGETVSSGLYLMTIQKGSDKLEKHKLVAIK